MGVDVGFAERSTRCPACGTMGLRSFYRLTDIPSHSVLLMPTPEVARTFPTGDLDLALCDDCGFITNTAFDPGLNQYSSEYEETQGFSPTFGGFAESLARRWIDRYDLHGKRILEVGCGKGEFLALMCEIGGNRGIGIDPAVAPERLDPAVRERLELIPALFSPEEHRFDVDVVLCRHTLEHIHPVADFLRSLRRSVAATDEVVVLFELPDVLRVLEEGGFWDLYYEHCSYFTPGSLARLFRREGFDVLDLWLDFDDQYILVEARPGSGEGEPLPLEDDLDRTRKAVERFVDVVGSELDRWRDTVREHRDRGADVAIWGAGSKGVAFLTTLGLGDDIARAVDVNPYKQGRYMPGTGTPVVAPKELVDHQPGAVIVMNRIYRDEIRSELDDLGVRTELLTT
jgi:SAM-dependent methyltransferase